MQIDKKALSVKHYGLGSLLDYFVPLAAQAEIICELCPDHTYSLLLVWLSRKAQIDEDLLQAEEQQHFLWGYWLAGLFIPIRPYHTAMFYINNDNYKTSKIDWP